MEQLIEHYIASVKNGGKCGLILCDVAQRTLIQKRLATLRPKWRSNPKAGTFVIEYEDITRKDEPPGAKLYIRYLAEDDDLSRFAGNEYSFLGVTDNVLNGNQHSIIRLARMRLRLPPEEISPKHLGKWIHQCTLRRD